MAIPAIALFIAGGVALAAAAGRANIRRMEPFPGEHWLQGESRVPFYPNYVYRFLTVEFMEDLYISLFRNGEWIGYLDFHPQTVNQGTVSLEQDPEEIPFQNWQLRNRNALHQAIHNLVGGIEATLAESAGYIQLTTGDCFSEEPVLCYKIYQGPEPGYEAEILWAPHMEAGTNTVGLGHFTSQPVAIAWAMATLDSIAQVGNPFLFENMKKDTSRGPLWKRRMVRGGDQPRPSGSWDVGDFIEKGF